MAPKEKDDESAKMKIRGRRTAGDAYFLAPKSKEAGAANVKESEAKQTATIWESLQTGRSLDWRRPDDGLILISRQIRSG